jgi:enoyl-CoA hydratase/carnithine racemase
MISVMFLRCNHRPLASAYDLADLTMSNNIVAKDTEEGIAAFVQKRSPDWDI